MYRNSRSGYPGSSLPQPSSQQAAFADPTVTVTGGLIDATTSSQLMARLAEKQAELENLQQVREASTRMVAYFEELGRGMEGLADGAQAVANVLSNWSHVFRVMSLTDTQTHVPESQQNEETPAEPVLPPVLVKIPTMSVAER